MKIKFDRLPGIVQGYYRNMCFSELYSAYDRSGCMETSYDEWLTIATDTVDRVLAAAWKS